ncbi:hypothetical protein [Paenibacillus marinisediminis]
MEAKINPINRLMVMFFTFGCWFGALISFDILLNASFPLIAGPRKQQQQYTGNPKKRIDLFFPMNYSIARERPKRGALFPFNRKALRIELTK